MCVRVRARWMVPRRMYVCPQLTCVVPLHRVWGVSQTDAVTDVFLVDAAAGARMPVSGCVVTTAHIVITCHISEFSGAWCGRHRCCFFCGSVVMVMEGDSVIDLPLCKIALEERLRGLCACVRVCVCAREKRVFTDLVNSSSQARLVPRAAESPPRCAWAGRPALSRACWARLL